MALDDATAAFLAQAAEGGGKALHEMTPSEVRAMNDTFVDLYGAGPDMHSVENLTVTAADGHAIPTRVLTPNESPRGFFVYFHGGGWVVGNPDQFDTLARRIAAETGCTVILPDYRLAPENLYPTAADDAWDVLQWAASRRDSLDSALPLVVGGDSSGGNLAAVVSQRAVRDNGPAVALQVLVYPVTDHDFDNDSYVDPANQLMLDRASMIWFWDLYAPDRSVRDNWNVSPLRADRLTDVAPAVVLLAEHDVLRDEGQRYADKLTAAGVSVDVKVFEGQMHGFFQFVNILPGADLGITHVGTSVRAHLDSLVA
ncbi:alpha/beta hydrolase [Rhodococcus sp. BP-252]|uniref:Esterase n=1 Tax=Rhodococcoides kyotonense TaxID=398843 RepID=A0A177YL73_9NOCA|nr:MULTISPECIES: alpha/beta hydrolase [Rhodococcus]MBY6412647.1 alpha/beta hydrolase [Rhodococcus sp. BP-320]MBY6417098.1 alpha/beta hydrolase [Rhodococcus sp. BP-321]MBY6423186.1 alpha/beta hydrolase [Rhodococcus sp. BP-324]MBY6427122.1 alpha/beta hydrolase [Rhodococcus sp. BP-323]MBY6432265.1 alpha/beta hydrolase [Rhodococcus sp. BP-322]